MATLDGGGGASASSGQWGAVPVEEDGQTLFALPLTPALDDSGHPLIQVEVVAVDGGGSYQAARPDFSVAGAALTWLCDVQLRVGDVLNVLIVPA